MIPSRKDWALKVSTLVVVTACFAVMGFSLLVSQNFKNILILWGEDVQMTVYLSQNISEKGYQFIEGKIKDSGKVKEIQLITQEKALADFRSQLASYAPDISNEQELLKLIPASLQVRLAENVLVQDQMQVLQSLAAEIRKLEGVDDVSYGQEWVSKYSALVSTLEAILGLIGLVILAASLFVISNAIRASIYNHKEEILVLEMVGATSGMIRKPFMIQGAVLGLSSSVIALVFCFLMFVGIKDLLVTKLSFLQLGEHLQFTPPSIVILFIAGGALLGAVASYICVRSLNTGFAGRMA
ncbi:MAG: cell division protein FtsX [Pseudobdellovibrionaceae bacterium]